MSTTGVPSSASRSRTRSSVPSTATTSTRCSPIGLGRCGERVANTPVSWSRAVAARVHGQDVAAGAVQPGQDQNRLARRHAVQRREERFVQDDRGLGCALVALPRSRAGVGQRGPDHADRNQLHFHPGGQPVCDVVRMAIARAYWIT